MKAFQTYQKLQAFANDKMNVIKKLKCVLGMIVRKGENAGHQQFFHFIPNFFSKSFVSKDS